MKLVTKIAVFLVITGAVTLAENYYLDVIEPHQTTKMAIDAVNGGNTQYESLHHYQTIRNYTLGGISAFEFLLAAVLFGPYLNPNRLNRPYITYKGEDGSEIRKYNA